MEVDGPPLDPARRAELARRIARMPLRENWREWDYGAVADTLGPAPAMVFLTEPRDSAGRPLAVYGFSVPLEQIGSALMRPSLDLFPLVQQATRRRMTNDSILALSVVRPDGRTALELSPRRLPDTYLATIPGGRFLENWTLQMRLDPAAASSLLVGGVPSARTPLLAALVAMAVLLILATAAVAWRALELARLRADFVSSVSHELRTPLAQILLFGETLSLGHACAPARTCALAGGIIVREARRLAPAGGERAASSRAGERRHRVRRRWTPSRSRRWCARSWSGSRRWRRAAEDRLARSELDECAAPLDDEALHQILLNLLDNAVKYGPPGQTVSLGARAGDGRARLWVEDDGPGRPAGRPRAESGSRFVRLARDVDRQAAGSGIGLAVVRELVARTAAGDDRGDAPRRRRAVRGRAAGCAGGRAGAGTPRRHAAAAEAAWPAS